MKILRDIVAVVINVVKYAVVLLLLIGLCCCRSQKEYVPVECERIVTVHDTTEHTRLVYLRDTTESHTESSTLVRDSIAPILDSLNRVIGYDRWHIREITLTTDTRQKALLATIDSLRQRRDSVEYRERPVPYPVTREVEKELGWWQTALMWTGAFALAAAGGISMYAIRKRL